MDSQSVQSEYIRRLADQLIVDIFAEFSVVSLLGPRASGKTTSLRRYAKTVIRLDVENVAEGFKADPDAALRGLPEPILLDEWQGAPEVLGAVKRSVDEDPSPGRYLLAGSIRSRDQFRSWPGTGRFVDVRLHPMNVRELRGMGSGASVFDRLFAANTKAGELGLAAPDDPPDLRGYLDLAVRGGFPAAAMTDSDLARTRWLTSYIAHALSHDVQDLEPGTKARDRQKLETYFKAVALNSAGVLDHRTIYEAAEVAKATGEAYESLLRDLLLLELLPAWRSNELKQLTERPKRYLVDSALVAGSRSASVDRIIMDGDAMGRILDTFVVEQLRPEAEVANPIVKLGHLRTQGGVREVDLVAEAGDGRVIGIEVKAGGASRSRRDSRHLAWMRDQLNDRFHAGIVFHTGPAIYALDERIFAVPIASLWAGV